MLWVVGLVRINGLRSLSKMTNFDFIMTVAMGSLVAGAAQATKWSTVAQVAAAMAGLFLFQHVVARLRKNSDAFETAIQNEPILLMKNGEICEKALEITRVARSDLIAKLREANVLDFAKVQAVVLETTGDVSVLHGDDLDPVLIQNIRDKTGD
ncbi:UPF0702 transmembrane protein YkjA [Alteripontixanthobacter maritimus]|uniref:UPF0702 transmembrane protein YkjA n=2 Tax=Alteripontixanthobacter maritimus TaxID=2161824 RepID=A0A369QCJ0_9SPHN|nr:UPF0702 transmembrane protein YkjA [Alteripontixanthobacter maritimus]